MKFHSEIVTELGLTEEEVAEGTFYKGEGCIHCNNTGYKGRTGLYEVLPVTPRIRSLILDRAPTSEIKKTAVENFSVVRSSGEAQEGDHLRRRGAQGNRA